MTEKQFMITLPCAGGRAANYLFWRPYLDCELIALDYPGHWERWDEPLVKNIDEMAMDIACMVADIPMLKKEGSDFYLLGHSMGCLVAWLSAQVLIEQFDMAPKGIILCAMASPKALKGFKGFPIASDEEIKIFLKNIRQVSEAVLESDFFHNHLMPFIRADFQAFLNCCKEQREFKRLPIPILAIEGEADSIVRSEEIQQWDEFTDDFQHIKMPGDHFFLFDSENVADVCKMINDFCAGWAGNSLS